MFECYVDILADFVEKSLPKRNGSCLEYVSSIPYESPDAGLVAFLFGQKFLAFVLYAW